MPQSLSAVYIHLVFSTKERRPFLRDKALRDALHAYMGGVSKTLECPPLIVGGVEDHVHLLCRFGRIVTQAEWVKELKRVSNGWLKEQARDYADFEWQGGSFLATLGWRTQSRWDWPNRVEAEIQTAFTAAAQSATGNRQSAVSP
jgi:REP element-mobilizing transposase RayT